MLHRRWNSWLTILVSLGMFGSLIGFEDRAIAQINPDETLGNEHSRVIRNVQVRGNRGDRIEGGAVRGSNLFHSFVEFNVDNGQRVYFANPAGVETIFSRVTGSHPSNILGTLGVDGTASLFLLNPNGILFGPNARLDIRGAFVASTANAIQFDNQGIFNASNQNLPPLLTVNPSALLFNQITAAPIVNQSRTTGGSSRNAGGLRVANGRSLLLVGGAVTLDGGQVFAPEGHVELASIAGSGVANLTMTGNELRLGVLDAAARGDVAVLNRSTVQVSGASSGSVQIQGRQVTVGDRSDILADTSGNGEGGGISIRASQLRIQAGGQVSASALEQSQGNSAGIVVVADDLVELAGTANGGQNGGAGGGERPSKLAADARGAGQSGGVTLNTARLVVENGARVSSSTIERDSGGSITINASDSILIQGTSNERQRSSALSVQTRGSGRAGDLTINTRRLTLRGGGEISATTYGSGQGGNLNVTASDAVEVIGTVEIRDRQSQENIGTIARGRLSSRLVAETGRPLSTQDVGLAIGTGEGGTLRIITDRFVIRDGAEVSASSFGVGDGGNVVVRAATSVNVSSASPDGRVPSRLAAETGRPLQLPNGQRLQGTGRGGTLRIITNQFNVQDGAEVIVDSRGEGRAGDLEVRAGAIALDNRGNLTAETLSSRGGNISLRIANTLRLDHNSQISASTETGQAGRLRINAANAVQASNGSRLAVLATSREGIAGDLELETGDLGIRDSQVTVSNPQGRAGILRIQANEIVLERGNLTAETGGQRRMQPGAIIDLQATDLLRLRQNSLISAQAFDQANGGNVRINASKGFVITIPSENNDIIAAADRGNGGEIRINAQRIFGLAETQVLNPRENPISDINASSPFGLQGTILLNTPDVDPSQGIADLPTEPINLQIDQRCQSGSRTATSRFVTTGRGGLPPTLNEPISETLWEDLRSPTLQTTGQTSGQTPDQTRDRPINPDPITTTFPAEGSIIEAQGWRVDANGNTVLMAHAPVATPQSSSQTPVTCHASL